jgi:adenosylcobinamide-GDP ribazoletransferase
LTGLGLGFFLPAWFARKLGGHTGDTYGAVVEWTEALFLVVGTALVRM